MKTLKSLVSWIEIPVENMERAKKFYEAIFEIQLQEMKFGDLTMAFFPVDQTGIGGALCQQKEHYKPSNNGIVIYLMADPGINLMLEKVINANGKIFQVKKQISENPEYGFMALIEDTEGNRIALYEK